MPYSWAIPIAHAITNILSDVGAYSRTNPSAHATGSCPYLDLGPYCRTVSAGHNGAVFVALSSGNMLFKLGACTRTISNADTKGASPSPTHQPTAPLTRTPAPGPSLSLTSGPSSIPIVHTTAYPTWASSPGLISNARNRAITTPRASANNLS